MSPCSASVNANDVDTVPNVDDAGTSCSRTVLIDVTTYVHPNTMSYAQCQLDSMYITRGPLAIAMS